MNDKSSHLPRASAFALIVVLVGIMLVSGISIRGKDFITGAVVVSPGPSAVYNADYSLTLQFTPQTDVEISGVSFRLQSETIPGQTGGSTDVCSLLLPDNDRKIKIDSPVWGGDFLQRSCAATLFEFADAIPLTTDSTTGNIMFKSISSAAPTTLATLFLNPAIAPSSIKLGVKDMYVYDSDGRVVFSTTYQSLDPVSLQAAGETEDCGNTIDDDGDGTVDCLDTDCATNMLCSAPPSPCSSSSLAGCSDATECRNVNALWDVTAESCSNCQTDAQCINQYGNNKKCQNGLCADVVTVAASCGNTECVPWFNNIDTTAIPSGLDANKVDQFCTVWFSGKTDEEKQLLCDAVASSGYAYAPDVNNDEVVNGKDGNLLLYLVDASNKGGCGAASEPPCNFDSINYVCEADASFRIDGWKNFKARDHLSGVTCPFGQMNEYLRGALYGGGN